MVDYRNLQEEMSCLVLLREHSFLSINVERETFFLPEAKPVQSTLNTPRLAGVAKGSAYGCPVAMMMESCGRLMLLTAV